MLWAQRSETQPRGLLAGFGMQVLQNSNTCHQRLRPRAQNVQ
jgi:hypothetical protein